MPTTTTQPIVQTTIVAAGASPVTLSIPPHNDGMAVVITSASPITVTAASTVRSVPIDHTP